MTERKDDGGPALNSTAEPSVKISLRDWFAGMVLQGMYAKHAGENCSWLELAREAYGQADAMLKVRQQ